MLPVSKQKKSKRVIFCISDIQKARLEQAAWINRMSQGKLINHILDLYFEKKLTDENKTT